MLHKNQISWSWEKLPITATGKWKLTDSFYFLFHPVETPWLAAAPSRLAAALPSLPAVPCLAGRNLSPNRDCSTRPCADGGASSARALVW